MRRCPGDKGMMSRNATTTGVERRRKVQGFGEVSDGEIEGEEGGGGDEGS